MAAVAGDLGFGLTQPPLGAAFLWAAGPPSARLLHAVTVVGSAVGPGTGCPVPTPFGVPSPLTMQTDYTAAIAGVTALVILLTAMTVFVLSRPSDLAPRSPR